MTQTSTTETSMTETSTTEPPTTEPSTSQTGSHDAWSGQIRRLRFCRIPLVVVLLLVGASAVRVSVGYFGQPSSRTADRSQQSEPIPQAPATPEGQALSGDVGVVLGSPLTGEIVSVAGVSPDSGTNQPADEPEPRTCATTDDGGILQAVEQAAGIYRSSVERRLISAYAAVQYMADSSWSNAGERVADVLETLAMAESRAKSGAVNNDGVGDSGQETSEDLDAVLLNPSETGGAVHYLVNGKIYSLEPGETHNLGSGDSFYIQFHRGEDFGNAEYTLVSGTYAYQVTEDGWDLQDVSLSDLP